MANKENMEPEVKSLIKTAVTRRNVLAGAGAVSGAAFLAACGGGGNKVDANTVRWGNWTLYLDYDSKTKKYPTLEKFKKEYERKSGKQNYVSGSSPDLASTSNISNNVVPEKHDSKKAKEKSESKLDKCCEGS